MTQITKKIYDEVDNYSEIEKILEKERYKKPFLFLYDYFFPKKNKGITCISFQKETFIHNQGNAYQILLSFCILNLLSKQKFYKKKVIFLPINNSWWHTLKEKLEKKEGEKIGEGGDESFNPEV